MFIKTKLITQVREERATWQARMLVIPAAQLEQPIVTGGMTVKEVIYHVAWHERQMTGMLRARALEGSPWWNLPTDERNAHIQAEAAPLLAEQVLAYAAESITELLAALEDLPAEALNDPGAFANMPPDWIPGELVAQNTYLHYREH